MRLPGVGICGEAGHLSREATGDDVVERNVLEHEAEAGTHGHPDVLEVGGRAAVGRRLGPVSPNLCQGAVEGPDDLGEGDALWWPGEPEPAFGAPLARDETGAAQVSENCPQKPGGKLLVGRELLGSLWPPGGRQREDRPEPVVNLRGDVHQAILVGHGLRPPAR